MNIGKRIKELRSERGVKATFVAEKIGIKNGLLSAIECERSNPTVPQLIALSDFFNVSIDYLVKGESNETSNRAVA
jgi:transcriptional regulator with XRE-family HTH domain